MDILEDFIGLLKGDEKKVDISNLFEDEAELLRWHKLVEVFDCIQIDNIVDGLKYKLNRDEHITVLAYVKFLELLVARLDVAKETFDNKKPNTPAEEKKAYSGSMYG